MEILELYDLLLETYRRANSTLQGEVDYLRAENRHLRQKLQQEMPQRYSIPPDLRSRYRNANCNSIDELLTRIRERRQEVCQKAMVEAVKKVRDESEDLITVDQPPTTSAISWPLQSISIAPSATKKDLIHQLGLDTSSTSSSEGSEVLSISASPLKSDSDHEAKAVTMPTQKKAIVAPIQTRKAILLQQVLREPSKASVHERIDRHGRDHGYMSRMTKFINPVTPSTQFQRCLNCRQRNRHLPSCSRQ